MLSVLDRRSAHRVSQTLRAVHCRSHRAGALGAAQCRPRWPLGLTLHSAATCWVTLQYASPTIADGSAASIPHSAHASLDGDRWADACSSSARTAHHSACANLAARVGDSGLARCQDDDDDRARLLTGLAGLLGPCASTTQHLMCITNALALYPVCPALLHPPITGRRLRMGGRTTAQRLASAREDRDGAASSTWMNAVPGVPKRPGSHDHRIPSASSLEALRCRVLACGTQGTPSQSVRQLARGSAL